MLTKTNLFGGSCFLCIKGTIIYWQETDLCTSQDMCFVCKVSGKTSLALADSILKSVKSSWKQWSHNIGTLLMQFELTCDSKCYIVI